MAYRTHRPRVKFEDNTYFVQETSYKSTYQGPRFPNLQSMFKYNSTQNNATAKETPQVIEPVHTEDKTYNPTPRETVSKNQEDVNSEAAEFIKRRHHSLELQKLLSMKAAS